LQKIPFAASYFTGAPDSKVFPVATNGETNGKSIEVGVANKNWFFPRARRFSHRFCRQRLQDHRGV